MDNEPCWMMAVLGAAFFNLLIFGLAVSAIQ